MKKTMLIVVAAGVLACYGASRTVNNATELYEAIEELNCKSSSQTIYLNEGEYDLRGHTMYGPATAHIVASNLFLVGTTEKPEDIIVYGDLSKAVIWLRGGGVRHLTVSNGVRGVHAAGSGSIMSNMVVTCCHNPDDNGGGRIQRHMAMLHDLRKQCEKRRWLVCRLCLRLSHNRKQRGHCWRLLQPVIGTQLHHQQQHRNEWRRWI